MDSYLSGFLDATANAMYERSKQIMGTIVEYRERIMMYACAVKKIQTKFEVLNTEFKVRYQRNPISSISTRMKRTSSITEKMTKQNITFSLNSM